MHTHSIYSHDSLMTPDEKCKAALKKGVDCIAFTDHCEVNYSEKFDIKPPIIGSVRAAEKMKEKYGDRLCILKGVELAGGFFFPEEAKKVSGCADFDVIIGSVHSVKDGFGSFSFSRADFTKIPIPDIYCHLESYYKCMSEMIDLVDFDVLAHMTYPLRDVCVNYGIPIDMSRLSEVTDEILEKIIDKKISLEINTAYCTPDFDYLTPTPELIKRYKELGGERITLASDAHSAGKIANRFDYAVSELKKMGFDKACIYKNRTPEWYEL